MLLPIGHDQTTVRRMPWITLGIMTLCVVVFVWTLIAPGDQAAIAEAELEAVRYYLDHPYLELDPELKGYLYYSLRQRDADDPPRPSSERRIRDEQAVMEDLTAAYFDARDRLPFWRWGVIPVDIEPAALLTYTFLHAGFLHLIGNLFFLYLVGPAIEDVWGRPLYLGFYLLSGAVAALVFAAGYPDLDEPLIGASGAIAGVMGAFAVRYWKSRITFFYFVWMIRIYQGTFSAPAGLMLGLWALGELAFAMGLWAFFSIADLGDVGFLAHVGGFAFGCTFASLVARLRVEQRFVEPAIERHETVHEAETVEHCLDLARRGRPERAMRGLEDVLAGNPGDPEAAAALWNTAVMSDATTRAVPAVLRAVEAAARAGEVGLLAQLWPEIVKHSSGVEIDLRTATRIAELLRRQGLDGDVELTLNWIAGRVGPSTPEALLVRLARLANELSLAAPFAALALEKPGLSPDLADELQRFSGWSA